MKNYNIAITTFSKRFDYLKKLLEQIRTYSNNKIHLIINGERDGNFNETYRKDILNICSNYDFIYPVFFTEIRGLTKMWNTSLIFSNEDDVLVLNDDIEIHSVDIFNKATAIINNSKYKGLCRLNGSFSHFVANKNVIGSIGYFDERLLGFGEEDGDIIYRLMKHRISLNDAPVFGLANIVCDVKHEDVKGHSNSKYSQFNRDFIYTQKYGKDYSSKLQGMFDYPMKELLENVKQYPYEEFFKDNKHKLF